MLSRAALIAAAIVMVSIDLASPASSGPHDLVAG
jgi:hypothetical protein